MMNKITDTEYRNLTKLKEVLTALSPNSHEYTVKETYLDFGADITWYTVVDTTIGVQVLSPKLWKEVAVSSSPIEILDIAKEIFSDKYCCDK